MASKIGPTLRGQSWTELEYLALSLIETAISYIDFEDFKEAIECFTRGEGDVKTVLSLIDQAIVNVTFDNEGEE